MTSNVCRCFIFFSFVASCGQRQSHSQISDAEESPTHPGLYVIGDSISTGVFAETSAASMTDITLTFGEAFGASGLSFVQYVAGGMSKKLDLESPAVEKAMRRNATAVSTTKEWGLRQALAVQAATTIKEMWHFNEAAFGDRAGDIAGQLDKLVASHEKNQLGKDPSHFVVFTGGNDFCSGKSLEEFQSTFTEGLKKVRERFQNSIILVATLPPVEAIPGDSIDSKTLFEYPSSISLKRIKVKKFKCHDVRAKFCNEMYAEGASERAESFRAAMEAASAEVGARYVSEIKDVPIEKDAFGADCFHPSEGTQVRFAEGFKVHL